MKELPDVQELIAVVNAEKYSLQAAAILGRLHRRTGRHGHRRISCVVLLSH